MGAVVSCCKSGESAFAAEARRSIGSGKHMDSVVMRLTETQLEEFRECFNAFDKDGGGSIDSDELEALMKSLGQEPTEQELAKMVLLADADGSGDIDFCEFVTLVAHKMRDEEGSLMQKRVKDAFAVFDTDNSGTIDAGEMRKIMYNLGEKMSLEQVDGMLRQFDENGDGQVDAQEFAKALLEEKRMGSAAVSSKSPRVDDAVRPF